jgi:hypothetical protein
MEKRMIANDFRLITGENREVLTIWGSGDDIYLEDLDSGFSRKLTQDEAQELIDCLTKLLGE